jgi:hypothetical protein
VTRGYDANLALNEERMPGSYLADDREPSDEQTEAILKTQAEASGHRELTAAK